MQKTTGGIGAASKYDWGDFFPHKYPYSDQVKAIRTCRSAVADNGYYVMEGPCGSGKTTISLTATLSAIDDDTTEASKVAVVTPLTSQREQFLNELRAINQKRTDADGGSVGGEVTVLEVAGKHEYLPYARAGVKPYGDGEDYTVSKEMKERTDELLTYTSSYEVPVEYFPESDTESCSYGDCTKDAPVDLGYCYSHVNEEHAADVGKSDAKARAILKRITTGVSDSEKLAIQVDGEEYLTPYPDRIPYAHEVAELHDSDIDGLIDPFRIGYYGEEDFEMSFARADDMVVSVFELVKETATRGVCPYRTLYDLLQYDDVASADVVVGNYHHILNPRIRFMFENYRGEDTLLVIDEAHMLAENARGLLGSSRSLSVLNGADAEWKALIELFQDSTEVGKDAIAALRAAGFERRTAIHDIRDFFDEFAEITRQYARDRVSTEFGSQLPAYAASLPQSAVLGVSWIGEETDPVTDAIEHAAQGNDVWETVVENPREVGFLLQKLYDLLGLAEDEYSTTAAAAFYLADWIEGADRDTYLRELEVSKRETPPTGKLDDDALRAYNASLNLYSTIPKNSLCKNVFSQYGGGIVMSATLEPLEQFTYETGIDMVEEAGRPVTTEAYDLKFPEENRKTFVVPNYMYVKGARGDATTTESEKTGTRKYYEGTLVEVGQTYGNIMFVLPSKSEANAMGVALKHSRDVSKNIFIDQGGDGVLEAFRASDKDSILVTYANGTLTTGVDYSGDDLHTVGVVGVSYPPMTDRTRAVAEVYEQKFDNGYKYGVTVPTVREARQALGRPIRGRDEGGVRLLIDQRYIGEGDERQVYDCLPQQLWGEIELCDRDELQETIDGFWDFYHMF